MEDVRFNSRVLHPEVQPVNREDVQETLTSVERTTHPYYTKYEYTTLLGIRAQQIADGAKPLISLEGIVTSSPRFVWEVASREIDERKLPFIIHRRFPNGLSEYWSANELTRIH
jgi:DNA-directed RNA polymerase subunit K/omega